MLKVLHLIYYPGRGGPERYILSIAEKLHNKSCVFYLAYSVDGPMVEQAERLGISTYKITMNSSCDIKAAASIKGLCGELGIDVIHTHFLRENYISIISRLLGNKVSLINTIHLLNENNFLVKLSNRMLTRMNHRIIAVSNSVKEQLSREGIDSDRIEEIHNGVDVEFWKGRRSLKIRELLGLERTDFVVTSTARFTEEKGHIFLLETIKHFNKAFASAGLTKNKVKFLLVGEGELLDECRKMSEMMGISGNVVFTGYREDIRSILKGSDLYISHSRSEALGLSILEAMASGLPVVATNAGGPREIIDSENPCGILVEYGDTDGFVKAIIKMASDRQFYRMCRDNASKMVEEKFNLDKMVNETYNLYIKD